MLTVPVYDSAGQKVGEESIDPALFGGEVNKQLLHDVVLMHLANRRVGTVNTRGRADVAGSGKKLFRQKGTGNARAGSKRTNKRKGGGVAFARRNRDYSYDIPKKAVRKAVRMALLSKFQDGQAIIVEGLAPAGGPDAKPQTKAVARVLDAIPRPDADKPVVKAARSGRLGARKRAELAAGARPASKTTAKDKTLHRRSILIGLPAADPVLYRSARNIEGVQVTPIAEFNTYDILKRRYLVLTREALAALKERAQEPVTRRAAAAAAQEG
jgi:large subunit ribosomal protein L4